MNDNHALPALAQPALGLVLPHQLAEQAADAVRELLAEAAAANTTRSYATALRYWAGWHAARYGLELTLPVPEAAVLQFVVDHVQRRSADGELAWELPPAVDQALVAAGLKAKPGPWTLATVRHRVAVLSTAHRLKQVPNPCEQPAVRTVLSRAARAAVKRGVRPRKKTAMGFSRDTCKNAPYNLFSLVDSFGCRIFLGASSVSAIGSQLRQQLLQRGHTHVGPQRLGLCLFATLPLLR